MRFLFGFPNLFAAAFFPAHAGAWLPEKKSGKIILSHIEQSQRAENIVNFRHKEFYQSLLWEYGAHDDFAVTAKYGQQRRTQPAVTHITHEYRLGLMFKTPKLASGLLPPYAFRLAKATLPIRTLKREKRASLTMGLQDENDIYIGTLALGDKITLGHFNLTQEVETERVWGHRRNRRSWLYRFKIGYDAYQIGTETTRFIDYESDYAELTHSAYGQWTPRGQKWQMRVKHGTSRAPLGLIDVQKNDYWVLELQYNF